jgi:hypothetical protein
MRLAPAADACFSSDSLQQKFTARRKALMEVFAGLLAGTMLVFTLLTASGHLHHALHHDGAAGGSACAICLFAKGQVDLPDASPVFAVGVFLLIGGLIVARTSFALDVISLLPPGRAPPHFVPVS